MKLEKLAGSRFRERPSECTADSYAYMVRGGYIKQMANGIFSSYLPLKRITRKIEQIMREEMDAISGQEVQFPVVMPASLWQESGRYDSIGKELMRFNDRNGAPLVLGMTHEEAAVHLVRDYAQSYLNYPFMIYQIQTKFRDEARPKSGLLRVREFTMKDAYSFHIDKQDLQAFYDECHRAYERIFARVGLPEVISVQSDSGMMGGNVSHEFMLLSPIGEDCIAVCSQCGYRANVEAAKNITQSQREDITEELKLVKTPDVSTIDELCNFLACGSEKCCKTVMYQRNDDESYVVLFIRGDYEVNETKLRNYLGCDIHPAAITEDCGLCAGYIGPVNLNGDFTILYDNSLQGTNNLCCGANVSGYHYIGLDIDRDVKGAQFNDFAKIKDGGTCPCCGNQTIKVSRGIEVGNIFQLGTKYTKSMNMTYLDSDGELKYPLMGCYGIGVGRLAAAICEAHHDDYGPIWPLSVAPWQVHLCALRADNSEVKACADKIYSDLQHMGIEVIYDDRNVSAGVMFADADLLGVPFRIIVSPRNLKQGVAEIASRDKTLSTKVPLSSLAEEIKALLVKTNCMPVSVKETRES